MAAPEGYNALGKIGISYKGEYASNTAYERLDAVYHNGSTYLAIKDAPDGAPRDDQINWIYLAKGFNSDIGDSEITFTEAETRENIDTGESVKTVFGKVKKWFADLTAAAFMQVITSYADLMAGTSITNYLVNAKAVQDGFSAVNSKLNSKVSITNGGVSIIKEVAADSQAFVNANFVATMPAGSPNRAGYGFHDEGICGAFLYLEPSDQKLHLLMNDGKAYIVNTTLINT